MATLLYINDFTGGNPSGNTGWQAIYDDGGGGPDVETLAIGNEGGAEGNFVTASGNYWEDNNHVDPGLGMVNLMAFSYHMAKSGLIGVSTAPTDLRGGYVKLRVRARTLYLPEKTRLSWWFQTYDYAAEEGFGRDVNYFQIRDRLDVLLGFDVPQVRRSMRSSVVTISIATPGVITWAGHGLAVNDPLYITTTGAIPTGLTAGTYYYVKTVNDINTFTVSATQGGSAINTTGSQSGVHTGFAGGQTLTTGWLDWTCPLSKDAGDWAAMGSSIEDSGKYGTSHHVKHPLKTWSNDMGVIAIHDSASSGNLIQGSLDISKIEIWGA